MHLMAGQTGNGRPGANAGGILPPWTLPINRQNDLENIALKEHSMATHAIIVQKICPILLFIQEYIPKSHRVSAGLPLGIGILVAALTALHYLIDMLILQDNPIRLIAKQLNRNALPVSRMDRQVKRKSTAVTGFTTDIPVG